MESVCAMCGGTGIIGNGPTSFNPQPCSCGAKDIFEPVRHLQGKHVKIIAKDHPWYDYTGRITTFEFVGGKPGCVIELDVVPDHRCTVFSGHDIKMI